MKWAHLKTGADGDCELFGVNIFEYEWKNTGKKINVKDPIYNQSFKFTVWKVEINDVEHIFSAGEFSNCVWGFYLPEKQIQNVVHS